jgi:hypothetical protein
MQDQIGSGGCLAFITSQERPLGKSHISVVPIAEDPSLNRGIWLRDEYASILSVPALHLSLGRPLQDVLRVIAQGHLEPPGKFAFTGD